MSMIFNILEEEGERLKELEVRYERELSELPKGTLSRKRRWNKEYFYLAYRKSDKVKFDYIGPVGSERVHLVEKKLIERKEIEGKLALVRKNLKDVERGLRGRR